ncbi:MAG TPA: class C sortase [Erysipelotrichaceae bacterium]|nr:class C sortase [Erysipelotrichaceae bacterium]
MLAVGIGLIAYPTAADWWNTIHQTHVVSEYAAAIRNMDTQKLDQICKEAVEYNQKLMALEERWNLTSNQKKAYERQLDPGNNGVMGSIIIPSLGITYPIYHGTSEGVLAQAIGHMEGSSLPVGGKGTHCVLSGHRGLPSAQLFTKLDHLAIGDRFELEILTRHLYYEIDQIKTVLPGDETYVQIDPEKDYCTLVTCTPYEVNTHRLLVRGHRVQPDNRKKPFVIPWPRIFLCLGMLVMLLYLLITKWKGRKKREEV